MLRAIIIDDEELSVKRLKRILLESGEVEVVRIFQNPLEAIEYKSINEVDAVFLDISMPEIDGISLSSRLLEHNAHMELVFVTGYEKYAVEAFDHDAIDYLLKPVTADRMSRTLSRIKKRHRKQIFEPVVDIFLFNGLNVLGRNGEHEPIKLRSPKTEELLAFLICHGTVSREKIIDTLWRGLEPKKALQNLNSTLYYIRKALNVEGQQEMIIADRNEIRINESRISCDIYVFERLLKKMIEKAKPDEELLTRAEALYTGELLRGKPYEWAIMKRTQLEQQYLSLLEMSAANHISQHEPLLALRRYTEMIHIDMLREDIHYKIIYLYVELGRVNEAIRQYRSLEQILERELGTKPELHLEQLVGKYNE